MGQQARYLCMYDARPRSTPPPPRCVVAVAEKMAESCLFTHPIFSSEEFKEMQQQMITLREVRVVYIVATCPRAVGLPPA